MNLDYLLPYADNCNIPELLKLKEQRQKWHFNKKYLPYQEVFKNLPEVTGPISFDFSQDEVTVGKSQEVSTEIKDIIEAKAKELIPWRKGPFRLFDIPIDAEWRSDFKWNRIKEHIPNLTGKRVLDIGCNNGYFMFRMLEQNPKLVLGIDPVVHNQLQFDFIQHFLKAKNIHFELFGVEHLPHMKKMFDVIFSMGIIYHHRHPIEQLTQIKESLIPGGTVILETIGIPGEESTALFPEDRYAKMKNVWFVPTLNCLINWTKRSHFVDVEVVSSSPLTFDEQRLTPWCPPPYQSLKDFIDPNDPTKTVEGHPAPMRFCIKAKRKLGDYIPTND